jgi:hypothetical protein
MKQDKAQKNMIMQLFFKRYRQKRREAIKREVKRRVFTRVACSVKLGQGISLE